MTTDVFEQAVTILSRAKRGTCLTGAGISIDSGIPPFRGQGGLWEKLDPMKYASIQAFRRDPEAVWNVLMKDMKAVLTKARPNAGHTALVELEKMGILTTVITQNIDSLHQLAGNQDVIEFHGTFFWQRCESCDGRIETTKVDLAEIPPRCRCGGLLRPDCVFFGEMIPEEALARSGEMAATCDVMLVVGTSATVQPASLMPVIARENGAAVIEINTEPTPLTSSIATLSLMGRSSVILSDLVAAVHQKRDTP
ncbi:NAD-dependent deacylase [Desulfosarcina sp. OttesenSCG-928-A07]|nr:NAD-dependent deacylase [Desulfosarcina sp. OttesenSCG-928-A07]